MHAMGLLGRTQWWSGIECVSGMEGECGVGVVGGWWLLPGVGWGGVVGGGVCDKQGWCTSSPNSASDSVSSSAPKG